MDHRVKIKENEKRDKYTVLVRELNKQTKKAVEYKGDDDTICKWYTWNNPEKLEVQKLKRDWKI